MRYRNVSVIPPSGKRPAPAPPKAAADGEARLYECIRQVVVDRKAQPSDAELTAALVAMLVTIMTENLQLKLGVNAEQARAAAIGWVLGRARKGVS